MSGQFQNKVALVTGGSSGIGWAASLIFAREGAKVVIADIAVRGGHEVVKKIKESGGEATFIKADIRIAADVDAMVLQIIKIYGRLDCAFNNAAIAGSSEHVDIDKIEEDLWDDIVNTNMKGVWLCMKYEIPQMLKQGKGAIVNTASAMAFMGDTIGDIHYTAAKHGVVPLTRIAALKYVNSGIRVNGICPGPTASPLGLACSKIVLQKMEELKKNKIQLGPSNPIGRSAQCEEIAEAAVWLCSDAASY
ncbi:MAG: SDR family oxidoreductase, partial [Dehalococcoidia bacterium]